jgi:CheY-like chemotaxis protein
VALLTHHAHRTVEADSGESALAAIRADRPDLVITDVLMTGIDGYELLRQIRLAPVTRWIPVIFYTAHYGARSLALAAGAAWFLTNADSAELIKVVSRVLAGETEGSAERSSDPAGTIGRVEARAESESLAASRDGTDLHPAPRTDTSQPAD